MFKHQNGEKYDPSNLKGGMVTGVKLTGLSTSEADDPFGFSYIVGFTQNGVKNKTVSSEQRFCWWKCLSYERDKSRMAD